MANGKYEYWLTEEGLLKLEAWARNGLTDEQIAHNMGVAYSTLRVWRDKYSALSAALKRGKEVVDIQVENALLKRALGYKYKEITKEKILQKDSSGKPLTDAHGFPIYKLEVTKEVTKEVVPDTTAQIFWLKNRKPDVWRDKQQIEHSGNIGNPFEGLTTEQLLKLVADDDG